MVRGPVASFWRYVRLSHNRRYLHYSDFASQKKDEPSLDELNEKIDLSTISSVVSNVSALGVFGKWAQVTGLGFGAWAYVLWLGLAGAWGAILVWSERTAEARGSSYLVFWSASWAWAGIVVLNPLVWPYWLCFCLPLFLAYVNEHARRDVAFGVQLRMRRQ